MKSWAERKKADKTGCNFNFGHECIKDQCMRAAREKISNIAFLSHLLVIQIIQQNSLRRLNAMEIQ